MSLLSSCGRLRNFYEAQISLVRASSPLGFKLANPMTEGAYFPRALLDQYVQNEYIACLSNPFGSPQSLSVLRPKKPFYLARDPERPQEFGTFGILGTGSALLQGFDLLRVRLTKNILLMVPNRLCKFFSSITKHMILTLFDLGLSSIYPSSSLPSHASTEPYLACKTTLELHISRISN